MNMKKVALVTGSARGIGRATAARLARQGWSVCINYVVHQAEAEALAAELRGEGCAVMVHANGARTVEAAAAAGADSVEHGAYLDRDAVAAMAENGTVWVPTLSAVGNLLGKGRFDEEQVRRILETFEKNLTSFASMGGLIACGSDAGAWAVPHAADTESAWLRRILGEQADRLLQRGNAEVCRRF